MAGLAPGATIVARATGTIVLAILVVHELWCRHREDEPKVQVGAGGSCLPPTGYFAHKIPHLIMRRAGQRGRPVERVWFDNEEGSDYEKGILAGRRGHSGAGAARIRRRHHQD